MDIQQRLEKVIPGGAHTYSRGKDQFPSNAPAIASRGNGQFLFDENGKKFLDYGMALRAVTLGYANPEVNAAAIEAISAGNNLTKPSTVELEAAEHFVSQLKNVDMVKFAKNGSNVTTAAVKVARASTGNRFVCIPRQQPFFSFDDWFIGVTPITKGIPEDHSINTLLFDYGDIGSLQVLFEKYKGEIACILMEPVTQVSPCSQHEIDQFTDKSPCSRVTCSNSNFLYQVELLCHENGALFILDEMITGFRWHKSGAQEYFGLNADLTTFGKAMANGFSLAALAGREEFMSVGAINKDLQERTFLLSSTHGAEMSSLAAYIKVSEIYDRDNVCLQLWSTGKTIKNAFIDSINESETNNHISIAGPDIGLSLVFESTPILANNEARTIMMQEMIKEEILFPWVAQSTMHNEGDVSRTGSALTKALKVVKMAYESGPAQILDGPASKPVFRKYN